jgi:hypothetical protein
MLLKVGLQHLELIQVDQAIDPINLFSRFFSYSWRWRWWIRTLVANSDGGGGGGAGGYRNSYSKKLQVVVEVVKQV